MATMSLIGVFAPALASHSTRHWRRLFSLLHICALLQEDFDLILSLHK